jgi:3-deoxy-7-phosphoheptulonate synthase
MWTPESWKRKAIKQLPNYDTKKLSDVEQRILNYPSLVALKEVEELKQELKRVAIGKAFILQGGDCAETFREFNESSIIDTFNVLIKMAMVLTFVGDKDIVRIGRFAGQFAKPRSSDFEVQGDVKLPSYRGDMINDIEFEPGKREPQPKRILQAYFQSAATLNLLRANNIIPSYFLTEILQSIHDYALTVEDKNVRDELINKSLKGRNIVSNDETNSDGIRMKGRGVPFYTSHEALNLYYEQSLLRADQKERSIYCSSAHYLWVGDRTRFTESAHIEFVSGIANPIGIKCGPSAYVDEIISLIKKVNPDNEVGKMSLIIRMGKDMIREKLPELIKRIVNSNLNVIWICDPMHGNTKTHDNGLKTRYLDDIKGEIQAFFEICKQQNCYPGGIHLEMTGKHVTECIGGSDTYDLSEKYETSCDPRLNGKQSSELAFFVCQLLKQA